MCLLSGFAKLPPLTYNTLERFGVRLLVDLEERCRVLPPACVRDISQLEPLPFHRPFAGATPIAEGKGRKKTFNDHALLWEVKPVEPVT